MHKAELILIVFLFLIVPACAGRDAIPVSRSQPNDQLLLCAHLEGELDNNRKRLAELRREVRARARSNARYALSNPLLMDMGDAPEREMTALYERNIRLAELLVEKKCDDGGLAAVRD